MNDAVDRARILLDEGLTPGFWASWEEHPAQPILIDLLTEVERLRSENAMNRRLSGQANYLIARIVAAANISAIEGDSGFIESYNLPVGPIHKAIPFLNEQGIAVTRDGQIRNGPDALEEHQP